MSFSGVLGPGDFEDELTDKIVFVGLSATGAGDIGPVPIDDNAAFVLVHMTAVSNMLTQVFVTPLKRSSYYVLMACIWFGFCTFGYLFRPKPYTYFAVVSAGGYIGAAYACIHAHTYVLPLTAPVIFMAVSYVSDVLIHYFAEEKEKQKIRGMFQTMVSPDVLHYMEDNPDSFSLAGERREATMFFSDVAGFTTISESLTPEDLVQLLNAYLTPMTEIILDHEGYVDKYEGDAIMAEWGVPYPHPEHARLACFAALAQQEQLAIMRQELFERFGHRIVVRMGLNSGTVSAGNMGASRRFSYTVMGDAVNQAARFEPANKDYDTDIIIGASTFDLASDHIDARLLDKIVVKGKTEPIRIYELLGKKNQAGNSKADVVALYEESLQVHWKHDFDAAIEKLENALHIDPEDGPAKALLARVRGYKQNPPARSWQGEYVRATKD